MTPTKAVLLLLLWLGLAVAAPAIEDPPRLSEIQAMVKKLRADLTSEMNYRLAQGEQLRSEIYARNVAFSVSFKSDADNHVGPFATDTTLIFDHIFINIGNAYNESTGVFKAPVAGVYQFRYNIFAGGEHGAGAKLLRNGEQVVAAYNHKAPHDINTSQAVSLLLDKGDTVSLLLEAGWWVSAYRGRLTTFSGDLLFIIPDER